LLDEGAAEVVSVDPVWSKLEHLERAAAARGWSERVALKVGKLEEVAGELGDFDTVLVDAPCSGLGTMRRHPETRWRRTADDVAELAAIQASLLDVAAGLVRPGGVLVYSVCTFTRAEGPAQVEAFLGRHPEFTRVASEVEWLGAYTDGQGDLALDPARHGSDGFYAARLRRGARDE
jgi:16S rRNA (cytosine967-C5)-methyltransferase